MIVIAQLSDIHLRENRQNPIEERGMAAAAALGSVVADPGGFLVLCTGDVAYGGKPLEYERAVKLFSTIRREIERRHPTVPQEWILIPGNHDCDFSGGGDVRPALLESVASRLNQLSSESGIVHECIAVQGPFFDFQHRMTGKDLHPVESRLFWTETITLGNTHLQVHCLNTSWMSQPQEKQGSLFFPVQVLSELKDARNDLVISILHHPYNWFEASNARALRSTLELNSDLILTGHEHDGTFYRKIAPSGEAVQYTEGSVLQESEEPTKSGFNVLVIDVASKLQTLFHFHWATDLYRSRVIADRMPLVRNSVLAQRRFEPSEVHATWLADPGTGFSHQHKSQILLTDLFIYPDLRKSSLKARIKNEAEHRNNVQSTAVANELFSHKYTMIYGPEGSGKTTLAKVLFGEAPRRTGAVPLYVLVTQFVGGKDEATWTRVIESEFAKQYAAERFDEFNQLDRSKRLILLDEFHRVPLNRKGQQRLLRFLYTYFGRIIVFADDVFRIADLAADATEEAFVIDFEEFDIRQFGHQLRERLIFKWLSLGREYTLDETELLHAVSVSDNLVRTLLGKNLIPSFPVNILTILQIWDATKTNSMASGSYGYMYEALINAALSSLNTEPTQLDTMRTFLSQLAYKQFELEVDKLEDATVRQVADKYFNEYQISFELGQTLLNLVSAHVLCRTVGGYSFRYKYGYYYFVAKYFQDNIANQADEEQLRKRLQDMANRVAYEDYANVLIFYLYLTKDRKIIEQLLHNAARIYDEHAPCDMEAEVVFLNRLFVEAPKPLLLPAGDVNENRERYRQTLDQQEDAADGLDLSTETKAPYDRDLSSIMKLSIALRTVQITGQILRNFPGSLRADLKFNLANETYKLGLRTISAVIALSRENIEEVRVYLASLIREQRAVKSDADLAKTTDEVLIGLNQASAYGIMKRVSYAVGLENLRETFQEVLERQNRGLSFSMLDVCIKLDHFAVPPVDDIGRLANQLGRDKNWFTFMLLRHLVADYLYLFKVGASIAQKLGSALKIQAHSPKLLDNPHKK